MSIGVPIAILVALAASVSAQFYGTWPNYKSEQKENSEQADKNSSKDKSGQHDENSSDKEKSANSDKSSSEKEKSGKSDKSASAVVSKGGRHPRTKLDE